MLVGNNALSISPRPVDSDQLFDRAIDPVSWHIGSSLQQGLLLEVATAGKPGLVCPADNGAHSDMSLITFMVGSATILPALVLCAQTGRDYFGPLPDLLPQLRKIGIKYERLLLESTGQVNTQRGALFSAVVLAGAAGFESLRSSEITPVQIFSTAAEITAGIVEEELDPSILECRDALTNGEKLFLEHGVTGIRGEAEAGFPAIVSYGLPALLAALEGGVGLEQSFRHCLLSLMARVEDTTVLARGGTAGLKAIKKMAGDVLAHGSIFTSDGQEKYAELERYCLDHRVSPGGSADLLAMTIAVYLIQNKIFKTSVI